jgi:hypothetical protein
MTYTIHRTVGAFRFHSLRDAAVKPELTCCVLGATPTGLIFLLHCAAIRWDIFFPSLAHRWFAALASTGSPPSPSDLKNADLDRQTTSLPTIGYPDRFAPYFRHLGRRWHPLKAPANDATDLLMLFHAARTFTPTLPKAPLQFAHYRCDHDLVYANTALQATIGLALLTLKIIAPAPTIYTIASTELTLHDDDDPPPTTPTHSPLLHTA